MTDWDKELAKIDKQLASMSDADLLGEQARPTLPAGKPAAAPAGRPSKAAAPQAPADDVPTTSRGATFMLYARVLLSVARCKRSAPAQRGRRRPSAAQG